MARLAVSTSASLVRTALRRLVAPPRDRRSGVERRSGLDRRGQAAAGTVVARVLAAIERRSGDERRSGRDRRVG